MMSFLRRLFEPAAPKLKSRLTAQQACAIAENAVLGTNSAGTMGVSRLMWQDGKLIWAIGSTNMGSGMTVLVDDATGTVLSCQNRRGR
jgi:hypothetical protein